MKSTYIRFENGQEDRIGDVLGPFEWVQITYSSLRVDDDGDCLAYMDENGYWRLYGKPDERWSDIIIFCKEK